MFYSLANVCILGGVHQCGNVYDRKRFVSLATIGIFFVLVFRRIAE